jgi:hypothetical protein
LEAIVEINFGRRDLVCVCGSGWRWVCAYVCGGGWQRSLSIGYFFFAILYALRIID